MQSNRPLQALRKLGQPRIKRHCLQPQRSFGVCLWRQNASKKFGAARGPDYANRVSSLEEGGELASYYPRIGSPSSDTRNLSASHFFQTYDAQISAGETSTEQMILIAGRVRARRMAGSRLVFFDVETTGIDGPASQIQIVCNQSVVRQWKPEGKTLAVEMHPNNLPGEAPAAVKGDPDTVVPQSDPEKAFRITCQRVRVGDWISISGHPHRTKSGELSLLAVNLPRILAPALHQIPLKATDVENINRRAHVKMLIHQRARDILRLRMIIEDTLDLHCKSQGMTRVRTPILASSTGGATAMPFETRAKELSNERLTLRIAPELYLKRLMVGGMVGVYELGPAFRNEGVDATHNPEFTICEYYIRFASLNGLMLETEKLLRKIQAGVQGWRRKHDGDIDPPALDLDSPFPQINFIPALEGSLRAILDDGQFKLPNFEAPDATEAVQDLYRRLRAPLPSDPTLARMLDDLSYRYLESTCIQPTWITYQPACLAPLAKSFIDEAGQHVSARAELFIRKREYVNCYEEENSPFEQRKKFLEQRGALLPEAVSTPSGAGTDADATISHFPSGIDENYIEALEWGLPPTGGWGCGVDRLVMLFAGADRIADVLPFGTLRNVVAMSKPLRA